jgi:hypothetical protein
MLLMLVLVFLVVGDHRMLGLRRGAIGAAALPGILSRSGASLVIF